MSTPGSIRRLYLYQVDLRETAWAMNGEPAPAPGLLPALTAEWVDAGCWERDPQRFPFPPEIARQRYAEGALCYTIRDAQQTLIYHLWISRDPTWIGWITAKVIPCAEHCLVFDAWAHPAWRGGYLHLQGAAAICETALQWGARGIVAGVEYHEVVPFARMYAQVALGLIEPYEVLVHEPAADGSQHHFEPPEQELVEGCRRLRERYALRVLGVPAARDVQARTSG